MRIFPRGAALVGRGAEQQRIDAVIAAARAGRGGALVLRGEPGVGKSALLGYARGAADGCAVMAVSGSQFETELPFAALHQLCTPLLGRLPDVPVPQREAMEVALGLAKGRPDPLGVGLAVLSLLASAAGDRPVVCLLDDAQWLDTASAAAMTFVARRIGVERIAVLFAVRPQAEASGLDELPALPVDGLTAEDSRALLSAYSYVPLDPQVRDRVVAEARGNPLALLEFPKGGGFGPPDALPMGSRIERGYRERLAGLSAGARMLLTVASADPTGSAALLWPAAQRLGLQVPAVAAEAAATGLAEFGARVRFCHPLARSAVYGAADPRQRRAAHRALAEVTDAATDPVRRAWHRAQAAAGPDDAVAADLERAAMTARSRGGVQAVAALLEQAAALTLEPGARIERSLDAAHANLDAGRFDAAADLLAVVNCHPLDVAQRARTERALGGLALIHRDDRNGAAFMLQAARRLAPLDPVQARECLIEALELSLSAGCASATLPGLLEEAARTPRTDRETDALDALLALVDDGHRKAAPLMRCALERAGEPLWRRWPSLSIMLATELWDPEVHAVITASLLAVGRASGAPMPLRVGLAQAAQQAVLTGDLDAAVAAIVEEEAIADATGAPPLVYHRLQLAAMRGRKADVELLQPRAGAPASGQLRANFTWTAAVLHNGLGDYPAALDAARSATSSDDLFLTGMALPEHIEAAVRCGEEQEAAAALDRLAERVDGSRTPTGLGVGAYARALVTGDEDDFREAVRWLQDSTLIPYRARAHLLYGEWLRRQGRRRDARRELTTAHTMLSRHGIEAFARRAADELRATGQHARRRTAQGLDQLTLQELHIARRAAAGATAPEIATQLFLSPRTVEAHLRNIYRKLGISSRRQLREFGIAQHPPGGDAERT
ncbi:AAA family ATPase [Dactylosporangium sp. NPDC051541]|uniref:helix-turn-helix transcriptional regulator n=1 Tax=Dactylosporangium sp. NPDC051541 TaxID=3363977 RepID=UPI0037A3D755